MIDDELVITVRVRQTPTDAHHVASEQLGEVVGATIGALRDFPGTLAGVEVALPTFAPYPDRQPAAEAP